MQLAKWLMRASLVVACAGALLGQEAPMASEDAKTWESFDISEVDERRAAQNRPYLEFFRAPDMSAGLYVLERGAEDRQSPHGEDEIYYVLEGRAMISVGEQDQAVRPGSVIYVKAEVPHRFHSIEERLKILVVFAPAFGTAAEAKPQ